jgi:uncharacterized protein with ATP-grasp and redox domains
MKTRLDCLPCFLNQGLKAARLCVPDDEDLQYKFLLYWTSRLTELDINTPPPAIAGHLYRDIAKFLKTYDPFYVDKKTANKRVIELLPRLRQIVRDSQDPLVRALEISIIGNYIDSGVAKDFPWEDALESEEQELDNGVYQRFYQAVHEHKQIMILGDNAGEIALDTILAAELQNLGCQVTYVVRGKPVINDATLEDAQEVGMSGLCEVISSGVDTPGTVLSRCDQEFLDRFYNSPLILSKGQGNLESLVDECEGIFYALKVKCSVVAELIQLEEGTSALLYV